MLATADIFLFEEFRLDRQGEGLSRRDQRGVFVPVSIGVRALDVLGVLVQRAGQLVSKEQIITAVWGRTVVENANLTVQISALRRVLDEGRTEGSCIQTVAARGYRFVAPVTCIARGTRPQTAVPAPSGWVRPEPSPAPVPIAAEPAASWPAGVPRLSIVVLPFANLAEDQSQQYLADAMTDDVTTDLSRIANLVVISRNTALTYRSKPVDTRQIGRDLGVRYVLEGTVRRSGDRLRVNTQLIDAERDAHLWAERFDGEATDLFAVQNEITSRIAVALNLELVGAEARRPTTDPVALDYLLRGRVAMWKPPTPETFAEAVGFFERSLALDPDSVEAQSLLAGALSARALDKMTDSVATDFQRAEALAGQALAASPRNPLAHYAKAELMRALRRCDEAIPEYETALASNRHWVNAMAGLGWCKFWTGSIAESIPLHEQAIRLSPRDPGIGYWYHRIGVVQLLQSRTDEAIIWLEKARGIAPALPFVHLFLASAYGLRGEIERGAAELAEANRLPGLGHASSIADMRAKGYWGPPQVRALFEATLFVGLRKLGLPEE